MRLKELIDLCERHNACDSSLKHLRSCKTMKEAMADPRVPGWAHYARCYMSRNVPPEARRLAERMALSDSETATGLRLSCADLSDEVKRVAELKACENYPSDMIRLYPHIHTDTVAKLRSMGYGLPGDPA